MNRRVLLGAIFAAVVTGAAAAPGHAQSVKLKLVADGPAGSAAIRLLGEVFIPGVEALAGSAGGYKIEWTRAFGAGANTQGKGAFAEIQSGEADLALVDAGGQPDRFPLFQVPLRAPFNGLTPGAMTPILAGLVDQAPEMRQPFHRYNQVMLAVTASGPWVLAGKFVMTGLDDLRGRKIGLPQAAAPLFWNTGAATLPAGEGEFAQGLAAGKFDAVLLPLAAAERLKPEDRIPHIADPGLGSLAAQALTANKDRWDNLPKPVRDAIGASARAYVLKLAAIRDETAARLRKSLLSQPGRYARLSEAERKRWADALPSLATDWTSAMKKEGEPGAVVLKAYLNGLAAAKASTPRDWSK
ncbi:MAG: hypothetical protein AB7F96_03025 [Beijerinckiaceae bacterium]